MLLNGRKDTNIYDIMLFASKWEFCLYIGSSL